MCIICSIVNGVTFVATWIPHFLISRPSYSLEDERQKQFEQRLAEVELGDQCLDSEDEDSDHDYRIGFDHKGDYSD